MRSRAAILVPTYNRASMLEDALASLDAQERYPSGGWDDVCVYDDGSTDDTAKVVARHSARYLKRPHLGMTPAFNRGMEWVLDSSDAPYVAWLGSDDAYTPDSVKLRVEYLDDHPDVGVVFSDLTFGSGPNWRNGRPHRIYPTRYDVADFATFRGNVHTGTAMFRREVWQEWNEAIVTGGADLAWVYALACRGVKFGYVPRVTYNVRRHEGRTIEVRRRMDPAIVKRELDEVYWPYVAALREGAL